MDGTWDPKSGTVHPGLLGIAGILGRQLAREHFAEQSAELAREADHAATAGRRSALSCRKSQPKVT